MSHFWVICVKNCGLESSQGDSIEKEGKNSQESLNGQMLEPWTSTSASRSKLATNNSVSHLGFQKQLFIYYFLTICLALKTFSNFHWLPSAIHCDTRDCISNDLIGQFFFTFIQMYVLPQFNKLIYLCKFNYFTNVFVSM